ncbi:MAG: MoaD/ThiS family protein [Geminicoccaceae bacterium]
MSTVTVKLPATLLALFPGAEPALIVDAGTVRDVVVALDVRWPGMRDRLCDSRPALRRNINIFVDGKRASLETELVGAAKVEVILAILG